MNSSTRVFTGLATFLLTVGVPTSPCTQAQESGRALDHESRLVSALRKLPEQGLKDFYLRCSRAADEGSLGSNEIALCSLGYEMLLNRAFGGDFFALLAWSRSQSREVTETAFDSVKPVERE